MARKFEPKSKTLSAWAGAGQKTFQHHETKMQSQPVAHRLVVSGRRFRCSNWKKSPCPAPKNPDSNIISPQRPSFCVRSDSTDWNRNRFVCGHMCIYMCTHAHLTKVIRGYSPREALPVFGTKSQSAAMAYIRLARKRGRECGKRARAHWQWRNVGRERDSE